MQSVNELDKFKFVDAFVMDAVANGKTFELTMDAVVVRASHPLNETCADRYADTFSLHLNEFQILHAFQEGYKYYDASDNLVEAVPDKDVPVVAYDKLIKDMKDSHIFVLQRPEKLKDNLDEEFPKVFEGVSAGDKQIAIVAFDIEGDEGEVDTTYWMAVAFEKAVASWHHLMNKPEN